MGKQIGLLTALLFGSVADCATPIILNHSLSAGAGDIIYLQGSDFGNSPLVEYSYNDSNWKIAVPVTSGSGVITLKIPGSETRLPDILTVRVSADHVTWSGPVTLNAVAAFGFDTDVIAAGSTFRVFGRNLLFGQLPTVRLVDSTTGTSQAATVDLAHSTHYALSVMAPGTILAGHTYKVFVSNGYSGNSQSVVESVADESLSGRAGGTDYWQLSVPWAADFNFFANIYNAKSDPRLGGLWAKGDGLSDDTWPIMHAIQVASAAGGGVIFLPDGKYAIHFPNGCGLPLRPNVVLAGSGANNVTVEYGFPMGSTGGYAVCFASHSGLVDLSLKNVDTAQAWQFSGISSNNSEVFLKRVTWNMGTSQWINFINDDHVAIEDSTINQDKDSTFNSLGPLLLQQCAHCKVSGNSINFVVGGQDFGGSSDLIFEGNKVVRDISSPADPSTVTHSIAANFVTNFIVLNNAFTSLGDTMPTNNDGEVINSEGGGQYRFDEFRGNISSATSLSLTDASQNFLQSNNTVPGIRPGLATVAIISGNALGQTRVVTAVSADGHTISVDHPWDVQPDQTSNYATFDWSAKNWLVVNNRMVNNYKGFELFSASAINILYESNSMTDSDGIMLSPSEIAPNLFNYMSRIDIIGNSLSDVAGKRPAFIAVVPREDLQPRSMGTHIIGATITSNNVAGFTPNPRVTNPGWDDFKILTEGFLCEYYWQSYGGYDVTSPPPVLATIFQDNHSTNADNLFYLNSGASQTAILGTLATNSGPLIDAVIAGAKRGSEGTVMTGSLSQISVSGMNSSSTANLFNGVASPYGARAIGLYHSLTASGPPMMLGQQIVGDAEVAVRITVMAGSLSTGYLLMSGGSPTNGAFIGIGLGEGNIAVTSKQFQQPVTSSNIPFTSSTAWLKLKKSGSTILAMYSEDGLTWKQESIVINFPSRVYNAGISAVSNAIQPERDVIFEGLTVTGTVANIPPVQTAGSGASRNNPVIRIVQSVRVVAVSFWKKVKAFVRHLV